MSVLLLELLGNFKLSIQSGCLIALFIFALKERESISTLKISIQNCSFYEILLQLSMSLSNPRGRPRFCSIVTVLQYLQEENTHTHTHKYNTHTHTHTLSNHPLRGEMSVKKKKKGRKKEKSWNSFHINFFLHSVLQRRHKYLLLFLLILVKSASINNQQIEVKISNRC